VNAVGMPIGKGSRDTCKSDTKAGALLQGCTGNCSRDAQIVSGRLLGTESPALPTRRIDGHFALIHRPTVARDGDRLRAPAVAR